ncbi:DUF2493 domain-containing protein [Hymenobacter sp. BT175]|uniref:DUF2493 domain-containing protein n=1 Tax=Hymenobacter translucens TaxID=2886507 RepID=UPI001D0E0E6D|nr:DUF2493 domain-containing protein [Hymenobacter translucens]MCC2545486.1 DUF2493 domain-containing protein [Hymenobacter translucens]
MKIIRPAPLMKLAILHTREFDDYAKLVATLDRLIGSGSLPLTALLTGSARSLAVRYAQERNLPCRVITPNYARYGSGAPQARNRALVDASAGLLAFHDGQSRTTGHAVELARARALGFVLVVPVTLPPVSAPAPAGDGDQYRRRRGGRPLPCPAR